MSSYLSWQKRYTSLKSTFPISFHWWLVTGISEYGKCSLATITKSQCNNRTHIRKSAPKHSLPESSFNRSVWRLWEVHIRMPVGFCFWQVWTKLMPRAHHLQDLTTLQCLVDPSAIKHTLQSRKSKSLGLYPIHTRVLRCLLRSILMLRVFSLLDGLGSISCVPCAPPC
jgi:hypothetical protein